MEFDRWSKKLANEFNAKAKKEKDARKLIKIGSSVDDLPNCIEVNATSAIFQKEKNPVVLALLEDIQKVESEMDNAKYVCDFQRAKNLAVERFKLRSEYAHLVRAILKTGT